MTGVNPYEPPLVSTEPPLQKYSRPALWRRIVSFAVHLLGYVFAVFASMLSLTWTVEALKPKNAPLESSLWIASAISITVGIAVLWLAGSLARWIAPKA
jgi:hypothetical protein